MVEVAIRSWTSPAASYTQALDYLMVEKFQKFSNIYRSQKHFTNFSQNCMSVDVSQAFTAN
jgi:N12 class adenine-specific DNA methylase